MKVLTYPTERLALFVDGRNLYGMSKALTLDIDYARVRSYFAEKGLLVSCNYYTPFDLEEDEDTGRKDFNQLKPLMDYLRYNGWRVFEKQMKKFTDKSGVEIKRGSMVMEIALDMLFASDLVEHFVLFTGHGDFVPVIEALQNVKHRRVTVVGSTRTTPPMLSEYLRGQADNFIELDEIREDIERVRK